MLAPKRNPGFLDNRFLGDVAENKKSETLRQGEESEMVDGRMRQQEKTKTAKLEHQEKLGGFNRFFGEFSFDFVLLEMWRKRTRTRKILGKRDGT